MMRRCVVGCSLLLLLMLYPSWQAAAAISPGALVRDIEIRGNRRTQEATIRFYLKTEVGKPYVPQTLSEDIKRLYALRTFDDIQVLADATAAGRAVLTHNRWDFESLHRQNQQHGQSEPRHVMDGRGGSHLRGHRELDE